MKAETRLKNLRKQEQTALDNVAAAYVVRNKAFVDGLTVEVRSILRAGGVLEREDQSAALPDVTE